MAGYQIPTGMSSTSTSGSGMGIGSIFQGLGHGVNFGSALGTLMGGKHIKKAIKQTIAAGQADAAAALLAAEKQAQQHQQNAYLANYDATLVAAMAEDEAHRTKRAGRAAMGQQYAMAAAQGALIDAPVLDIIHDQYEEYEVLAGQQRFAGELQKRSLQQQRDDFLLSAQNVREEGESVMEQILAQASLDAYKLKLQRREQVIGALGTMVQSVGGAIGMFQGLRGIGQATTPMSTTIPVTSTAQASGYAYQPGAHAGGFTAPYNQ